LINTGEVIVNNDVIKDEAVQVHENNNVVLKNKKLIARKSRYLMVHKPLDTVCSNIDESHPSVFNYISLNNVSDFHIAGRLDADTTGLVLITDDGRWSFNIISPNKRCEKIYRVSLRDDITDDVVSRFNNGIQLQGEKLLTLPAKLEILSRKEVLLTITEGRYHQVKRMFAAVGNRVHRLHREEIGGIRLNIDLGQWRYLTEDEIALF